MKNENVLPQYQSKMNISNNISVFKSYLILNQISEFWNKQIRKIKFLATGTEVLMGTTSTNTCENAPTFYQDALGFLTKAPPLFQNANYFTKTPPIIISE